MPRTLENIVESHRIARERRERGERIWDHDVKVGDIFADARELRAEGEAGAAQWADIGQRLAERFRTTLPAPYFDVTSDRYDWDLNEAIEDIETLTENSFDDDEHYSVRQCVEGRMGEIYDRANIIRIWIDSHAAPGVGHAAKFGPA